MRQELCEHYVPCIKKKMAQSLLKSVGKSYECQKCGLRFTEKEKKKIVGVVDYLNDGGDDDKILSELFRGITVGEISYGMFGKIEWVNGATVAKGYIPQKNRT